MRNVNTQVDFSQLKCLIQKGYNAISRDDMFEGEVPKSKVEELQNSLLEVYGWSDRGMESWKCHVRQRYLSWYDRLFLLKEIEIIKLLSQGASFETLGEIIKSDNLEQYPSRTLTREHILHDILKLSEQGPDFVDYYIGYVKDKELIPDEKALLDWLSSIKRAQKENRGIWKNRGRNLISQEKLDAWDHTVDHSFENPMSPGAGIAEAIDIMQRLKQGEPHDTIYKTISNRFSLIYVLQFYENGPEFVRGYEETVGELDEYQKLIQEQELRNELGRRYNTFGGIAGKLPEIYDSFYFRSKYGPKPKGARQALLMPCFPDYFLSHPIDDIVIMSEGLMNVANFLCDSMQYDGPDNDYEGANMILTLDDMNIRGEQIDYAFRELYNGDWIEFANAIRNRDENMIKSINDYFRKKGARAPKAVKKGATNERYSSPKRFIFLSPRLDGPEGRD